MSKWWFAAVLGLQAHFAASYLVPLDQPSQRAFGGLLRWFWPWAIGDSGPLGRMTAEGFPLPTFFIAVIAAGLLVMAAMSVAGIWVPAGWWRGLAIGGAGLSLLLFAAFLGPTKLLPILVGAAILAAAVSNRTAVPR